MFSLDGRLDSSTIPASMDYYRTEHPATETLLCDHFCDGVADYLEVNELGHEYLACRKHTASPRHAATLAKRTPNPRLPHRTKPVA